MYLQAHMDDSFDTRIIIIQSIVDGKVHCIMHERKDTVTSVVAGGTNSTSAKYGLGPCTAAVFLLSTDLTYTTHNKCNHCNCYALTHATRNLLYLKMPTTMW